jgi:predicted porin
VGIGFAVQDLFAKTNYDTSTLFGANTGGARSNDYPTRIKLGGSYSYSSDLLITADYEIQILSSEVQSVETSLIEGRPITNTVRSEVTTNTQIFRIGGSYQLHPRITVRSGLQALDLNQDDINLQPSAGFSLHLPFDRWSPAIDYAFVREPSNISTMHVFSIRLQI